jgi:hypothetical protein
MIISKTALLNKMKQLLLFLSLIFSEFCNSQSFNIYAEKTDESNKILWLIDKWNPNTASFDLIKKNTTDGSWRQITNKIQINTEKKKDISGSVLGNQKFVQRLTKRYKNLLDSDSLKSLSYNEISEILNGGMIPALNSLIKYDFEYALFFGFGFVDFKSTPLDEYRLKINLKNGEALFQEIKVQDFNSNPPIFHSKESFSARNDKIQIKIRLEGNIEGIDFFNFKLLDSL